MIISESTMAKTKLSTDEFIRRAKLKHGNRYDYSQTFVNGTSEKVKILCSVHGEFFQMPSDHLYGRGCSLCNERQRLTTEQFINKATVKHGMKYDYSLVDYVNSQTKIKIICQNHGEFLQKPNDHLTGYGCPECGGVKRVTTNSFITRATNIHHGFYSYGSVVLDGMNKKVWITCPTHGEFLQRPADHLSGVGCMECSLGERGQYSELYFNTFPDKKTVPACLYLVQVDDLFCKVGITIRTVSQRFGTKQVKSIHTIKLPLYDAYVYEQQMLGKFKQVRYRASGLRSRQFAGWTECFPISLIPELVKEFVNISNNLENMEWQN